MAPPKRALCLKDITPDILKRAFDVSTIDGKQRVKCVHCNWRHSAEHLERQRGHLIICRGFKASLPEEFWDNHASSSSSSSQRTLTASGFVQEARSETDIDNALGMAVFTGRKSLAHIVSKSMRELMNMLNPEYPVPDATKIMSTILPNCYANVRSEVFETLSRTKFLNITIDERIDFRYNRSMNIFVADSKRYYFIAMRDMLEGAANANQMADWVISELRNLTSGDFSRINSITTTTQSTMETLWPILRERKETKNAFFFGCDSHGFQHLVDDILSLPSVKETVKNAVHVLKHFYDTPRHLATLRKFQQEEYGQERPLLGLMLTNPTSKYHMLLGLKNNDAALVQYARRYQWEDKVKEILRSTDFLWNIGWLVSILKDIQEHVEASEKVSAHAGDLLQRWVATSQKLGGWKRISFGEDILSYLDLKFQDRMYRQVQDLHWAAYLLNPKTIHEQIPASVQQKLFGVIQRHCENPQEAIFQFSQYRAGTGEFYQGWCWKFKDEPKRFWSMQLSLHGPSSDLANLALRLFHTTAISTPSERAFSALSRQTGLPRYGVTAAQTDMVNFIYLNDKALQEALSEVEVEEEQLAREDDMIYRALEMERVLKDDAQSDDEAQPEDETESEEYKAAIVQVPTA